MLEVGEIVGYDVEIHLIDTLVRVDVSVEINRSIAVLDEVVLTVDNTSGIEAIAKTVWNAMTPGVSHNDDNVSENDVGWYRLDPLFCLAMVKIMDKEHCDFRRVIESLRYKFIRDLMHHKWKMIQKQQSLYL